MRVWRTNDVAAARRPARPSGRSPPAGSDRAELRWERAIALRLRSSRRGRRGSRERGARSARSRSKSDSGPRDERASAARPARRRSHARRSRRHARPGNGRVREPANDRGLARAELALGSVHWFACRYEEFAAAAERAEQHYAAAGFSPSRCIAIQAEALYYGAVPVAEALVAVHRAPRAQPGPDAEATVTAVLGGLRRTRGELRRRPAAAGHARGRCTRRSETTRRC